MSDILIRGMEMPKTCAICKIRSCNSYCPLNIEIKFFFDPSNTGFDFCTGRHSDCPLHELQPHGDLKDANKLLAEFERDERAADEHGREFSFSFDSGGARCTEWWIVQQKLMDAPVIVPASEEEANDPKT